MLETDKSPETDTVILKRFFGGEMPGPTLREIADQMYITLQARPTGRCYLKLRHGLHIVLERNEADMLLKLGRERVYPSVLETTLCKRAFRLADDHPAASIDPTADGWCVVAICWRGGIPQPKRG
jgi:hypothetical protein